MYATVVCNLAKYKIHPLDFVVTKFLMKLFKTSNLEIIKCCIDMFNIKLRSTLLPKRSAKFMSKYTHSK